MKVSVSDVRRLLRALGNPRVLRRDPLASRLPTSDLNTSIREILAVVSSSPGDAVTTERRRRAAHIIERCDLQGCGHKEVAEQLGLSRRQFYRDRLLALEVLATELERRAGGVPGRVEAAEERIPFEIADAFLGLGRFDDAHHALSHLASSAATGDQRLRALARILESACESGDRERVRRSSEELERAAQSVPSRATATNARVNLARALVEDVFGSADDARARREAEIARLRAASDRDDDLYETLAVGLVQSASAARVQGEFRNALAHLREAEELTMRLPRSSMMLRAQIPNELGATLMLAGETSAATAEYRRCVAFSREHGLMRVAVCSTLNNFVLDHWQGHTAEVYGPAAAMLDTARSVLSREELARISLLVAQIALSANRLNDALALVNEVKRAHSDIRVVIPRAILAETEVYLKTGNYVRAVRLASDAVAAARDAQELSLLGVALLYSAEAYAASGNRAKATATVHDALSTLERAGSHHVLARAQRLSSALCRRSGSKAPRIPSSPYPYS